MDVGVDHVEDSHPRPLGRFKVRPDVADRIDDGGRCLASATEEVRGGDGVGMKELAQDHRNTPVLER